MPAGWASLPRDLLAHIFNVAASAIVQNCGEDGVGLAEAAALLAAFSPCRWWRAVALEEVRPAEHLHGALYTAMCSGWCVQHVHSHY